MFIRHRFVTPELNIQHLIQIKESMLQDVTKVDSWVLDIQTKLNYLKKLAILIHKSYQLEVHQNIS